MSKAKSFLPSKDALQKRLWHFENETFKERAPALFEFLSTALVDGEERRGGSISLFASNGALKVCFLDKHTQLAFYGALDGAGDLVAVLEGMLVGEHEPWAPIKPSPGKTPF